VVSELKKNKKAHPEATMVLDDNGSGVDTWDLGDAGTGLLVTNNKGIVKFFTPKALSKAEMAATVELIRANLDD
jgi:predicted transcriptional regulator